MLLCMSILNTNLVTQLKLNLVHIYLKHGGEHCEGVTPYIEM